MSSSLSRNDRLLGDSLIRFLSNPISIGFRQPINGYNELHWEKKIEPKKYEEARKPYLDAMAALAASRIEEGARCGKPVLVQAKMAKLPSDINLRIDEYAMRSITDNKKKVDVRGPVFLTVRSVLE